MILFYHVPICHIVRNGYDDHFHIKPILIFWLTLNLFWKFTERLGYPEKI